MLEIKSLLMARGWFKSSAMDLNAKMTMLETSLERAADALGDITDPVMERYYGVHPARGLLSGSMVWEIRSNSKPKWWKASSIA